MSALATLKTGLLLGLYALLAGVWGVLYAMARLRKTSVVGRSAAAAYALHAATALTVVLWTPLGLGWKCLIIASSLVFLTLPPITWRFLEHTHRNEGSKHDRQPSQHSARVVARL
jgi:hypothetical protein